GLSQARRQRPLRPGRAPRLLGPLSAKDQGSQPIVRVARRPDSHSGCHRSPPRSMLYPQVVEVARSGATRRPRRGAGARRVALVTGGSGALSRAVARRLARDGLAIAVNEPGDGAAEVADAIRRSGGIADAFSADVTD